MYVEKEERRKPKKDESAMSYITDMSGLKKAIVEPEVQVEQPVQEIEEVVEEVEQPIQEIAKSFESNVIFATAERGDEVIIPRGDFIIEENDDLYVIGKETDIISALGLFLRSVLTPARVQMYVFSS